MATLSSSLACAFSPAAVSHSTNVHPGRLDANQCLPVAHNGLRWRRFLQYQDSGKLPRGVVRNTARTVCSISISEKFAELKKKGEVALIPFLVAGDPDLDTTAAALLALSCAGANVIELGVPYSDPLADGPVIQAAAARALAKGTDLDSVLQMLKKVSPSLSSSPVVLFTYFNPIMKRGAEQFMKDAKDAGAAGLVVPDVPLEETGPLRELTTKHGLELVLLTTPTTPAERMGSIAEATQGFLYLVSLTGVTGMRSAVESRVEGLLKDIKAATAMPVAVGFGISTPEHAKQVISWGADGVIIGSALVRLLSSSPTPAEGVAAVAELARSIKEECYPSTGGSDAVANAAESELQSV